MPRIITLEPHRMVAEDTKQEDPVVYTPEMPQFVRTHMSGVLLCANLVCGTDLMEAAAIKDKVTNVNRRSADLIFNIKRKLVFDYRDPRSVDQYGEECLFILFDRTKHMDRCIYSPNYKGCDVKYDDLFDEFELTLR